MIVTRILFLVLLLTLTSFTCSYLTSLTYPLSPRQLSPGLHRHPSLIQNKRRFFSKGSSPNDKTFDSSSSSPTSNGKTVLEQVASKGLAGVLAIFVAEAIFWAAGVPLAELWFKLTSGEWIDLSTSEGQLKATAFSFGYGGFATVILQYRVTLFAIPLVPIMEKLVVDPLNRYFGKQFNQKVENSEEE
eukprot:gene9363-10166_t